MCYRDEFGRSALKDVGVNTGELQIWGAHKLRSLGIGVHVAETPETRPLPVCVTTLNLVVLRQRVYA